MKNNNSCCVCASQETDGIKINRSVICEDCEKKLVNTLPTDPDYDQYLNTVKNILFLNLDHSY
jgi:hypothetical protein